MLSGTIPIPVNCCHSLPPPPPPPVPPRTRTTRTSEQRASSKCFYCLPHFTRLAAISGSWTRTRCTGSIGVVCCFGAIEKHTPCVYPAFYTKRAEIKGGGDAKCRAEEAACDAAEEEDNSVVVKAVLFIGSVAFGAWVLTGKFIEAQFFYVLNQNYYYYSCPREQEEDDDNNYYDDVIPTVVGQLFWSGMAMGFTQDKEEEKEFNWILTCSGNIDWRHSGGKTRNGISVMNLFMYFKLSVTGCLHGNHDMHIGRLLLLTLWVWILIPGKGTKDNGQELIQILLDNNFVEDH